jgi:proteasome lid subunit RPN8/RPN11
MAGEVIVLTRAEYAQLRAHLLPPGAEDEEAAFAFADLRETHGCRFVPREWMLLGPDDFEYRSPYHLEMADTTRAKIIKRAHDLQASIVEFHSHPQNDIGFSPSDLAGLAEFVPHVWWRLKSRPYAAVVVAPGGIDGLAWTTTPEKSERIAGLNVDGRLIKPWTRRWWHWRRNRTYA